MGEGLGLQGAWRYFGVTDMLILQTVEMILQVRMSTKTYQIVHFEYVWFIVHQL